MSRARGRGETRFGNQPQAFAAQRSVALLLTVLLAGCESRQSQPVSSDFLVMGTFASIAVPAADSTSLPEYAAAAESAMRDIENALSVYKPDSEISRVSQAAGTAPVPVSKSTQRILLASKQYAELSGGAFDVTVSPLLPLWGFGPGGGGHQRGSTTPPRNVLPPPAETINSMLAFIGSKHLVLTDETAHLEMRGMGIDLGGIAKGYAVDVCYDRLSSAGACNFMVNLGGNIRCRGLARPGKTWQIGVRDPFDAERKRILGVLTLTNGMATATSGNYERFVEIDGERYGHILDPRTGYPVKGMAGVTVVCPNATQTDAMSTTLFVLGIEAGSALLRKTPDCGALFVPDRQPLEIYVNRKFQSCFTPLPQFASLVRVLD